MNLIAERVKVTDKSGHEVDIKSALDAPLLPTERRRDNVEADDDADDDDAAAAADDDAEVLAATQTDAPAEPSAAEDSTEA